MSIRALDFNGQTYGNGKVFVIAELGTAHGGDKQKARELVAAAAESGADCVKFQMVYADEILHPNTGTVILPGGPVALYDVFKKLEVPLSFFEDLKIYAEQQGLVFLCTPFGLRSSKELQSLQPKAVKIASPELNYTALLKEVASYALPCFISSGVSRLSDIENALQYFSADRTCLLHCITSYPAPEREYNLNVMENLSRIFGIPVGISDHSMDPLLIPLLAASLGACVLEKHFCLSRSDPGLDDPIALEPAAFAVMCSRLRELERLNKKEALTLLSEEFGEKTIAECRGDGIKRPAESEKDNYERTNRSIHALKELKPGDLISKDNMAVLRTEKQLRPGLPPSWESKVLGRTVRTTIPSGEGIRFEDL